MEGGEVQGDEALLNFARIMRKVHFHVSPHIEGLERNPIVRLELVQKYIGPVHGVIQKPAITELAELEQQDHGDGRVGGAKIANHLGGAVLGDAKILFLQAIQVIAIVIGDDDIDIDHRDGHRDGEAGLA